jgi:hypothetical protein
LHFEQVALSGVTIGAVALLHPQSDEIGQLAKDIGTVKAKAQNVVVAPSTNFRFIVIFPPFMVLLILLQIKTHNFMLKLCVLFNLYSLPQKVI